MRRPIVAANWKMHKTVGEATDFVARLLTEIGSADAAEVVLCPPFTALQTVGLRLAGSGIKLGAQNVHPDREGAFTGEVSSRMLRDVGCDYVIVGHSERRGGCQESDEDVNRKARAARAAGLRPIICVGETLEQREAGRTAEVVRCQLEGSLAGLDGELLESVIAYEPVWAIGTGKTATTDQAQEAHDLIRRHVRKLSGEQIADALRIQYGGSVKPDNAANLFACPDVDGGLIGGASLEPSSFAAIARAAGPA